MARGNTSRSGTTGRRVNWSHRMGGRTERRLGGKEMWDAHWNLQTSIKIYRRRDSARLGHYS